MPDKMETTKTEKKNTTAYQLKKLLCKKEKQDLGNVERWKQIPVEYIVTANTLGIELNDYALKRLNESEDKDHALEAIYVTQFFTKEAKKLKKHDLADKLEAMAGNESLKAEDIAFYATKAIENELPKDKVLKKLAKAYLAEKEAEKALPQKLEDKVVGNTLDIVVVPLSEKKAYVYTEEIPESLDNVAINVYGIDAKPKDSVKAAVNAEVNKDMDSRISSCKVEIDGCKEGFWSLLGVGAGFSAVGGLLYAITKTPEMFYVTAGVGTGLPLLLSGILGGVYFCEKNNLKGLESRKSHLLNILEHPKINWLESRDLKGAYESAFSEKELPEMKIENNVVEKALRYVINHSNEIGLRGKFLDAYKNLIENLTDDKFNEMKIDMETKDGNHKD
ncbi:MAG: hypothetical protein ABIB71_07250 [Candidatus Woesearchaeota archaeon]